MQTEDQAVKDVSSHGMLSEHSEPSRTRQYFAIENHGNDSRYRITDGTVVGLNSRCGTGGGNVPLVLELS